MIHGKLTPQLKVRRAVLYSHSTWPLRVSTPSLPNSRRALHARQRSSPKTNPKFPSCPCVCQLHPSLCASRMRAFDHGFTAASSALPVRRQRSTEWIQRRQNAHVWQHMFCPRGDHIHDEPGSWKFLSTRPNFANGGIQSKQTKNKSQTNVMTNTFRAKQK